MRRHPARDVDADRGDLPRRPRQPDAGEPVDPLAREAERRDRADERFLEVAHVLLHVAPVPLEVEDRVADELARPVEGGLAAAVRLDDLDVGVVRDMELAVVGAAPERDDGRVLETADRVSGIAPPRKGSSGERERFDPTPRGTASGRG